MAEQFCVVDHVRPGTKLIGGRWFCDDHYARAVHKRTGVWRSAALAVVALLVFVGAVVGLDLALQPQFGRTALLLTGVVLALVPALLWLLFFYQQDRLEPEPVGQVARVFVVGLALAGAIGIPLTDQLFRVGDWLYRDTTATWLGSIFVTGIVEAFILYAVVRFFIFDSPEFDERTDGVVYGTAAGLGYATALNLQFILANQGAALGAGEIFVAEVALAQAAFGGLLGYFLGRAKLEREPVWWLPLGLALTALLNGLFNILRGELDAGTISVVGQGAGLPSFTGLLLSGVLAVIITAVVSMLINRDIARSLSPNQPPAEANPQAGDRQANLAVIGTFVVLLLIGALAWNGAVNSTRAFNGTAVTGNYPAYFSDATTSEDVLRVADLGAGTEFSIVTLPVSGGSDAAQAQKGIAAELAGSRSTDFAVYKARSTEATVQGQDALRQEFTYVDPNGLSGALPQIRQGVDYIFIRGGQAYVVTLLSTPDALADAEPQFNRFLNSLRFQ